MKQTYFTRDTLDQTARKMLQGIKSLRHGRKLNIQIRQSVLLVLDVQQYFLSPDSHAYIPSAPAIIPGIQQLIRAFVENQAPVIFTRHLNTSQNAASMSRWWRDLITEENPLSQIIPELNTKSGFVLEKSQYDAFFQTDLEYRLKNQNVTQVVICGVMTHLCCETTARSAFMRGFEVFFSVDGTATYNEDFHRATLLNISHGFATPVLTSEVLDAFESKGDSHLANDCHLLAEAEDE
jgi:bifunctional isochorismate lyase/aryl carrier protein